jgi:hypothetical protein
MARDNAVEDQSLRQAEDELTNARRPTTQARRIGVVGSVAMELIPNEGSVLYWSELARNWASAFTFVVALMAGLFGLFRYLRSERMRQTEQVRELYRMFFESERYRRIRFVLANPDAPEFAALKTELASPGMPRELEGELIDLLNFLEFVSGLTRRGLVSRRDIDWMFSNFIDRVVGVDFVRAYVLRSDFDELVLACKRVERAR